MKLTKNKRVNLAILKVIEGLGIVFIPYLAGLIPLAIRPELQQKFYGDSIFVVWLFGIILIFASVLIIGLIGAIICTNLNWAKDLKRD